MTTRHRILLAAAGLIAASVVQLVLTASVARNRATAFDELAKASTRTGRVADVSRLVTSMQALQRGYLLTEAASLRRDYEAAYADLKAQLTELADTVPGDGHLVDLATIERTVEDWHRSVSLPLFARVESGAAGTIPDFSDVILREGIPRLKTIEEAVARFDAAQDVETRQAVSGAFGSMERGMRMLLVLPVVAIAVLLLLASYLYRHVLRPIGHFTDASERIAAGDYAVSVPVGRGSDELAKFGQAFNAMRRDVSLREAALQKEQQRLGLVVNSAPVALVLYDQDGRVFLQNALADGLFGPQTAGATTLDANAPADMSRFDGRALPAAQWPPLQALKGKAVAGAEVLFATPDGTRVPVIASAVPLHETTGELRGAVAAFQDVSHRFELERIKDDFVSVVSHELRTPLTSMRGALQLALDSSTDADDREQLLTVALANTERLVRMVNDILDVAKIEAGKLVLSAAPTQLPRVLDSAIKSVQVMARQAGVGLSVRMAPDVPMMLVDADRLVRAVVNLLSNAVKVSSAGQAVDLTATMVRDTIEISVTDQGPGIATDKQALLFERFQQLESIDIRRSQGTGLGLAITRGIVVAHGGQMRVRSAPGEGSTFTIALPLLPHAEVAAQ